MKLTNIKKLNEAVENIEVGTNNLDTLSKDDVTAVANPTYVDAIESRKERVKEIIDRLKDNKKAGEEVVKENQREAHMNEKLELQESLFEDYEDEEVSDEEEDEFDEIEAREDDDLFTKVYDELIGSKEDGNDYPYIGLTYTEVFADAKGEDNDIVINKIVRSEADKETLYKARDIIKKHGGTTRLEQGEKKGLYILHGMFGGKTNEECEKKSFKTKLMKEDLQIICDISDYKPWSGAVETWDKIRDAGKIAELDAYLEDMYPDGLTMTGLNDILWFDGDNVLYDLGIVDEAEETDEE